MDSSTGNSLLLELLMVSDALVEVDDPGILWFRLIEATTSNMTSNDGSVKVNKKIIISSQITKANIPVKISKVLFGGESLPPIFCRFVGRCSLAKNENTKK